MPSTATLAREVAMPLMSDATPCASPNRQAAVDWVLRLGSTVCGERGLVSHPLRSHRQPTMASVVANAPSERSYVI